MTAAHSDFEDGPALSQHLAARIHDRILTGEIQLGSWLRQDALAAEFGVSRTPVREALRSLHGRGILEMVPHRGALVRGPTVRDVRESYEVRAELEGFAAELAAARIRDEQLARLRDGGGLFREAIERFVQHPAGATPDHAAEAPWVRANDQFHEVIHEAAANRRLQRAIGELHRTFPRSLTWAALSGDSHLLSANVEQHETILTAIEGRLPLEARAAMRDHVKSAGELVAMWFESQIPG